MPALPDRPTTPGNWGEHLCLACYSGGFSGAGCHDGGTDAIGWACQMRRLLDDPYSPAQPDVSRTGSQPDLPVRRGAELRPSQRLWTCGYLMALYNTRCVRRSNALLNWAYVAGCVIRDVEHGFVFRRTRLRGVATLAHRRLPIWRRIPGLLLRGARTNHASVDIVYNEGSRGHYKVETYRLRRVGALCARDSASIPVMPRLLQW